MGDVNCVNWTISYINEDGKEYNLKNVEEQQLKTLKQDKVIFNEKKKTTVVLWKDGTKTIVKASDNDVFDKRVGYLMAFYHKNCGMSKTKANRYIDELCEEETLMYDVPEVKITPKPLKVGDKVRVLNNDSSLHGFKIGEVVELKEICNDNEHLFIENEIGITWYMCPEEYERV